MFDSAYQNPLGYEYKEHEGHMDDAQKEVFLRQAQDNYAYCIKVAKMFKGKEGKEVLKKWREDTIESAAWMPSISMQHGREAAIDHAFAREGQNAFIKSIEQCIRVAHECKTLDEFCALNNQPSEQ